MVHYKLIDFKIQIIHIELDGKTKKVLPLFYMLV